MKKPKHTKPNLQKPQPHPNNNKRQIESKGNRESEGSGDARQVKGTAEDGKRGEYFGMGSLKPVNGLVYYQDGKPMAVSVAPDETARELAELAKESTRATSPRARKKYRKRMFLLAYGMTANATVAAVRAGIDRSTAYKWCEADPDFAREWKERGEQAIDLLEFACWNRAVNGTERPIWMKDKDGNPSLVGTMTEYSDRLAELLLSANRPAKYRKNVDVTSAGQQITPGNQIGTVVISLPDNGRQNAPQLQNPIDIESQKETTDTPAKDSPPGGESAQGNGS